MKQNEATERGLLLEDLAQRLRCVCLSDLKMAEIKEQIGAQLEQMEVYEYTLTQWQEALDYLLDRPQGCRSSAEAREQLIAWSEGGN